MSNIPTRPIRSKLATSKITFLVDGDSKASKFSDRMEAQDKENLAGENGVFRNADKASNQLNNIETAERLGLDSKDNFVGENGVFQNSHFADELNSNLTEAETVLSSGRRGTHASDYKLPV